MNVSFDFGKWLIETRHKHHLSQDDLAQLIMINSENISKYENGKIIPNLHTVNRVAECMGYEIRIVPKSPEFLKNDES